MKMSVCLSALQVLTQVKIQVEISKGLNLSVCTPISQPFRLFIELPLAVKVFTLKKSKYPFNTSLPHRLTVNKKKPSFHMLQRQIHLTKKSLI